MTELKNVKKKTRLTFQDWSLEAAKWGENKTLLDTEKHKKKLNIVQEHAKNSKRLRVSP